MPSNFKGLNEGMGHLGAGILGVKKGSEQGAMIENMLQAERSDLSILEQVWLSW